MYPIGSMDGGRSREFKVLACCLTAHLLQRRMQGLETAQSCPVMYDATYTSQFEHEYESSYVLLSYFRTNNRTFIHSFQPCFLCYWFNRNSFSALVGSLCFICQVPDFPRRCHIWQSRNKTFRDIGPHWALVHVANCHVSKKIR